MRLFPIQTSQVFKAIPWGVIENCNEWAQRNHQQSLGRLAERGGLSPMEAVAVIEGKAFYERWKPPYGEAQKEEAERELLGIVAKYAVDLYGEKD